MFIPRTIISVIMAKNIVVTIKVATEFFILNLLIKYIVGFFNITAKIKANTKGRVYDSVLKNVKNKSVYIIRNNISLSIFSSIEFICLKITSY
ncbi:hypothetical protein GCM10008906_32300 [Clostridium oceanicum]|uniref:Uncharacterized protein n=1 Tax=Clostridium oceanicum TaxID=1543 RepID=A0ABN1JT42_9CLOT